jgi:Protein of unknown function (DUF3562)
MNLNHSAGRESANHQSTIEALARESRADPAYVRKLYEKVLAELEATAKVRSFLFVLACRNVRAALLEARAASRK